MGRPAGNVDVEVIAGSGHLRERLRADMARADRASIAVAFAKETGVEALDLEGWCDGRRELRLLAGTDFYITELAAIRRLEARPGTACRLFHGLDGRAFHPKVYLLEQGDSTVAYVGSSNLTAGGMKTNVEANVRIEGSRLASPIAAPLSFFESAYAGEFSTAISPEFERRYAELQAVRHHSSSWQAGSEPFDQFRVAERMLIGDFRGHHAANRWLLVVTPQNFEICMRTKTWGRQHRSEIEAYTPGDVFFFHVTRRSKTAVFGMFTGRPYHDPSELWDEMDRGSFPWRIRFVPLGVLHEGIETKSVLTPLRPNAPKRWFNGFIQASHSLQVEDFAALRIAFENKLRAQVGLASA